MTTSFIVVDDFLENAHELRDGALRLTYPEQAGGLYPGRNSMQRIEIEGLAQQVSRLAGEPLRPISPPQSHAKCRITRASDMGSEKARVHVDASHWSGILYLNRPEHCRGGTHFYRHVRTGTDGVPLHPERLRELGYSSPKQMMDDILPTDSMDMSKWELLMTVPMRFNRLLLLRPWFWHNAGDGFGETLEDSRLVYLMFFESAARR